MSVSVKYHMKIVHNGVTTEVNIKRVGFRKYKGSITTSNPSDPNDINKGAVAAGRSIRDVRRKLGLEPGIFKQVQSGGDNVVQLQAGRDLNC